MIEFSTPVRIEKPREQVFLVLVDFENYLARWAKGPVSARRTAGDGSAGSRYVVTARMGPVKVRSLYEVTASEPPQHLAGRSTAGPVRFEEEYDLSSDQGATLLTQSIRARPRGPFRAAEALIRRQLRQLIASDLDRLKVLVESEAPH